MPSFASPSPIAVTLDLNIGTGEICASPRRDTVVEVRPRDPSRSADVRAAEDTRVDYVAGELLVKSPKRHSLGRFDRAGSIDLTIEVPTGSHLHARGAVFAFRARGELAEVRIKTASGDIELERNSGVADLDTSIGDITVGEVGGNLEATTASGRIRIDAVRGRGLVKNSNGDTWIGLGEGDLRIKSANGNVTVDRAVASLTASTARGDLRVREIRQGSVSLETAYGEVEIGICPGTAARLDVRSSFGTVRNDMEAGSRPEPSERTVEVVARTNFGDIIVHRSPVVAKASE